MYINNAGYIKLYLKKKTKPSLVYLDRKLSSMQAVLNNVIH